MTLGSLHVVDLLVLLAYLVIVIYFGHRASKAAADGEGFFLAGRRLGKLYQFLLNFGNSTDANGAVSTAGEPTSRTISTRHDGTTWSR